MGNKKDRFAIFQCIESFLQRRGIVSRRHGMNIGIAKVYSFDFLPREKAGAIGNRKPAFG